MNRSLPRAVADAAGTLWTINRAWPERDGGGSRFEATALGRPGVRGGSWTPGAPATLLPSGSDDRLPALAGAARHGTVLVHRPHRRAVVRSLDGTRFTKVVRPGRAPAILDGLASAAGFAAGFRLPEVLEASDDVVTCGALAGRSLFDLGQDPGFSDSDWLRVWQHWGEAWHTVLGAPTSSGTGLPIHDAEAEVRSMRRWGEQLRRRTVDPGERDTLSRTMQRVEARLLNGAEGQNRALSHRDLHDKQLLWHPLDGIAVIDLDTIALAEPALDLGNLRAHLELRVRQGLLSVRRCDIAQTVIDTTATRLGVPANRVARYEAAALFRLGCLYAFRPRWVTMAWLLRERVDSPSAP